MSRYQKQWYTLTPTIITILLSSLPLVSRLHLLRTNASSLLNFKLSKSSYPLNYFLPRQKNEKNILGLQTLKSIRRRRSECDMICSILALDGVDNRLTGLLNETAIATQSRLRNERMVPYKHRSLHHVFIIHSERAFDKVSTEEQGISIVGMRYENLYSPETGSERKNLKKT